MKWKIGNVKIDNQIVLAPMARYGDSTFRRIVKSMGCGLIETEMVHDKSLANGSHRSRYVLYMTDYERPLSQQILVSDVESVKKACKIICDEVKQNQKRMGFKKHKRRRDKPDYRRCWSFSNSPASTYRLRYLWSSCRLVPYKRCEGCGFHSSHWKRRCENML